MIPILRRFIFAIFCLSTSMLMGQPGGGRPPGGTGPCASPPCNPVPISGIEILVGIGGALGVVRVLKKSKKS